MTQATYVPNIANDNAQALAFFEAVFAAIATNNSGPTEPTETFAGMFWLDTSGGGFVMRQRNAANSAWLQLVPDITTFAQGVWDAGTEADEGLISPLKLQGVLGASIASRVYDYQEFTASGTWIKPASALTGDKVIVQVIGGGGAGGRNNSLNNSAIFFARGGGGAGGVFHKYQDIADLSATETVTVGAGATGRSSSGTGATGGNSEFRSAATDGCVRASGGPGGTVGSQANTLPTSPINGSGASFRHLGAFYTYNGENSGGGSGMVERGGGSGGYAIRRRDTAFSDAGNGSPAQYGGDGGNGQVLGVATSGSPYGGGGGASLDGTSGNGGNGIVRVWCVRERT